MTQSKLQERLYDILIKSDKPIVVSLSGEWGIGKTHFWQKIFLENYRNELSEQQFAYISLFGHNSLNDIKTDVILQISKTQKFISKFKDKLKSIKGAVFKDEDISLSLDGGTISAALSLMTQSDFKDVIICFDDFERLSSKIEIKDIMGFISNLKEQKNCKIVMIMNEKELEKLSSLDGKKYSDIYNLYKEKIVDYDFSYTPNIEENFQIVFKKEKPYKALALAFFKEFDVSNIRIIQQVFQLLNEFDTSIMNTEIHEKVIKEFLFTALSIFIFKVKFGFSKDEYFQLKEYYYESSNKSQVKNEQKEEQINYLYRYGNDAYESIVLSFLEHETYDKTHLQEILKHNSQYIKFLDKKDGLMYSWKRLHSDFSYNIDDFLQESLPTLFSDTIEKVLNLGDFHFFIEFVKKHQSVDSMKVDEIIKRYIDDLILREKSISIHESQNFEIIDNHYPYLKKYADNKKHEILIEVAQDELIAQTLKKCLKGWGEKDQYILNNSEVSKYKEMILNNPEFIEDVVYFLKKGVNDQYFSQAIINIQQALSELANENENYRFKVEKILKK